MIQNIFNLSVKSSAYCNASRMTRHLFIIFLNFLLINSIKQIRNVGLYLRMQVGRSILILILVKPEQTI